MNLNNLIFVFVFVLYVRSSVCVWGESLLLYLFVKKLQRELYLFIKKLQRERNKYPPFFSSGMNEDFIIFELRKEFRLTQEIDKMLAFLVDQNPIKYESESHLIRCLITAEYNRVLWEKQHYIPKSKKTKVVKHD